MITKEQVADLQRGDVVTFHDWSWPDGHEVTGPVYATDEGGVAIASHVIRFGNGDVTAGNYDRGTLTVVSRAPRPLYANHPRTEPVNDDIAKDRDGDVYRRLGSWWYMAGSTRARKGLGDFAPLTLLWDGETGQAVP